MEFQGLKNSDQKKNKISYSSLGNVRTGHAGHTFPADLLDPTRVILLYLYLSLIGAGYSCISG